MLKGGITSFEVVSTRELEVLAMLMGGGGRKKFSPFKKKGGGRRKKTSDFPIL